LNRISIAELFYCKILSSKNLKFIIGLRLSSFSGYIAEKDQNYREAAARYGQAWKYGGKTKLSVGYKLAYCCLKAKVYADAIEACNEVLKQNTDYPRIRKDILEKCINNLRT